MLNVFFILISCSVYSLPDTLRVEPPNWWTGMKTNQLQLLIHGEHLADYHWVKCDHPYLSIQSVDKVESNNYLFVNLHIDKKLTLGTYRFELVSAFKPSIFIDYEFRQRRLDAASRNGFDSSDVIYLIMPDRFANGDPGNDHIPGLNEMPDRNLQHGRHGGDIQGIIDHLDYMTDLGITAIWSTPLLLDNEASYSYHGYAISDLYRIDPRYGTNDDYRRLSELCHDRGLKLIMDMVPNHCASTHWWMDDLPQSDWIHQFDGFMRSNHRKQTVNDPYKVASDYQLFEQGWFDITMPDLNQSNELLLNYLTQNAIWWIEFADLDGLRVDTYTYNEKWQIARWTAAILQEYPFLNIVGETWLDLPSDVAYWQKGAYNTDGYDSNLPSVMDFCLNEQLQHTFNEAYQHWDKGLVRLYDLLSRDNLYNDPLNLLIFCDNHDMTRFADIVEQDINRYMLAYSYLFTTRGIPQIYYGSEIMMKGHKSNGDGDLRKDFPGGWPGDERSAFNALERTPQENEVFNHFQKLLNWRKNSAAVQYGDLKQYIPVDNIYIYSRSYEDEYILVILNNNERDMHLDTNKFSIDCKPGNSWLDILSEETFDNISNLTLKPKSALI
jgi:glycosidase